MSFRKGKNNTPSPSSPDTPMSSSPVLSVDFEMSDSPEGDEFAPIELKSPRSAAAERIARDVLRDFGKKIWRDGAALDTFVKGTSISQVAGGGTFDRLVPKTLAMAWKEVLAAKDEKTGKSAVEALATFLAIIQVAHEHNHGGRNEKTQAFYAQFINKTGKDFFPLYPEEAHQFDMLLQSQIDDRNMAQADPKLEAFLHNMEIEEKNISDLNKRLSAKLADTKVAPEDKARFEEGKKLLGNTLTRFLTTYSIEDRELYRQDFHRVLKEIFPDEKSKELADLRQAFGTLYVHHNKMVTDLGDRFDALYLSTFLSSIAIAAEPLIGAIIPLPSVVKEVTLGHLTPAHLGKAAGYAAYASTEDISELPQASPIMRVKPQLTSSERGKNMWESATSSASKFRMAVSGASFIVGTAVGTPILGIAVSGAVSAAFLAKDHFDSRAKLNGLKEVAQIQKQEHNEQFCRFMHKVIPLDLKQEKNVSIRVRVGEWRHLQGKMNLELSSFRSLPTSGSISSFARTKILLDAKAPAPTGKLERVAPVAINDNRPLNPQVPESPRSTPDIELQDFKARGKTSPPTEEPTITPSGMQKK